MTACPPKFSELVLDSPKQMVTDIQFFSQESTLTIDVMVLVAYKN